MPKNRGQFHAEAVVPVGNGLGGANVASRQHDLFWQDDLQAWLADGTLQRLDLAFSRDQAQKRYVQHCLREAADAVRAWIARGAVVYVCGNRAGMAHDVDLALQDILGAHGYQDLFARSGYRRDVY